MKIVLSTLLTLLMITACKQQDAIQADSGTDPEAAQQVTKETARLLAYPHTRQSDTVDHYFGTAVPDPYRWLEDDLSDETAAWVKAQNEVTFDYLEQIPFREQIRQQLTEDWNYERQSAPTKYGDYYFFSHNDGLQNHSVIYRIADLSDLEDGDIQSRAEVFLDPNTFSDDGTTSLAGLSFTNDGSLAAYAISEGGSDWRKVIVRNTATMEQIGDTLVDVKFSGISWYKNEGFYYSSYENPDGSQLSAMTDQHKLYFHRIGTPQSEDELVFGGEETPRRYVGGGITEDQRYLVIWAAESTTGNELYVKDLEAGSGELIPIIDNFDSNYTVIDTDGDRLLIHTNREAPNYRLVAADINNPAPENWVDIIPETDHVLTVSTAGGYLFASYLIDVQTEVRQLDYDGNLVRVVELPSIGTAGGFSARKEERTLYYVFTSFTYPSTIYKYDTETGASEMYWMPDIDFNPEEYVTEQVFYESPDGTEIPMFITYKKGLELDGTNPTYLFGYGGFNVSLRPSFSISRLIWLENGGIYAQPNIRGGGEYGERWHHAGIRTNRQNVFDDFIAAGEYLIDNGYTSSERLAIAGGSNGGLLVGAVMTQRPDLAAVAFPAVGVLDMLRYHTFTAGAGWAFDYGTSEESEEMFQYLLGYSPVHNVREGTVYPSTMITTADHDDRVVPAHSYKFAAELQAKHAGDNPVIIRIETRAGHGAGRSTESVIREWADRYAFAWFSMGIHPFAETP
ncbi:prolyl oligopeptidase family serine peptidase [Balneolales bacterium ANBcel1]|nr:prolyl oligopeptidase family serine peptidase [Balneolales bacterium ANBcel1]